ncbi:RRM domain-containing protein [Cryptosporidium ubiquitum]|uniref:RRM domain-containing protein n=1 Tax=Cryptosporidium ubiquitum TaxID=857276 RepID=A0A1J4MGB0_9CRYT|nr:RRM domain-containing protein [Cryptosporidium ubiquitum]OII73240.1 RRM domain-containing protein [Cryptosporidium ubiquitum]
MTENYVFIRNLSPLANKESVLNIFSELEDEIVEISFHNYPESDQRFCQISFKSSNGVTKSIGFNGSTLLGVPMSITVLPPIQIQKSEQKIIVSNREISVKNLPSSLSDSKITSIFQKYGQIVSIKRQDLNSNSNSIIIEFQNETSAADLIEKRYITLENGDTIEISSDFEIQKCISNQEINSNNHDINDTLLNLESIPVPLAYQQIKKLEWDSKISKIYSIKKKIEERLLNTLNDDLKLRSSSNQSSFHPKSPSNPPAPTDRQSPNRTTMRRTTTGRVRSLSRSVSPPHQND